MVLLGSAGSCSGEERPPATDLAREPGGAEATGSETTASTDETDATADSTDATADSTEVAETTEEPRPGAVAAGGAAVELPRFATVKEMLATLGDHSGPRYMHGGDQRRSNSSAGVRRLLELRRQSRTSAACSIRNSVRGVRSFFAMTSLDTVTVSTVATSLIDADTPEGILEEYRETVTIHRKDANRILQDYHGTTDYSISMEQQGPFWTTTDAFDVLMLLKSDEVLARLANSSRVRPRCQARR